MKNKFFIITFSTIILLVLGIVLYFFYFLPSPSTQIITDSEGNTRLINALRTEPDFSSDTYDSALIFYGTVTEINSAPEQILNHNQKYTITIQKPIKGDKNIETVEVYALGGGDNVIIEHQEKMNLKIGDTGIFFLGWMPQDQGFYTFFGGPRGVLVETDGKIKDWDNKTVTTNNFIKEIEKVLKKEDVRPEQKTLGDMLEEVGY